jgi:hypothetical protein
VLRTIEAVVEPDGSVRLLEPISISSARRALVTVLDESPGFPSLADWNRPEEDAAWQHFQTGADLVALWEREGIIGSRTDIADPAAYARQLRTDATSR